MDEGVDLSWSRPGGSALKSAGKKFVMRYAWPGGGKGLTLSELSDYRNHNLAVGIVYESTSGRALAGYAAGVNDAKVAQGQLAALRLPATLPLYFAVDFDATPAQQPAVDAYLNGAASVIGRARTGVYGSYFVCARCRANGTATWLWQTYAWSGGRVLSGIHVYQYKNGQTINGGSVDFCRSYQPEFGQSATSAAVASVVGKDKEMKLIWNTTGGGYLLTEDGMTGLTEQEYKLFYRLINSDQTSSPFVNGKLPDSFNQEELNMMNQKLRALAIANATATVVAPLDPGVITQAVKDALVGASIPATVDTDALGTAVSNSVITGLGAKLATPQA